MLTNINISRMGYLLSDAHLGEPQSQMVSEP